MRWRLLPHPANLFLILDDGETDFGMFQGKQNFFSDGVLIDRDWNCAQALGHTNGPIHARAVIPNDRNLITALDA